MNYAKYLIKEAVSRARRMLRSGQLSGVAQKKLRAEGMLPTREQMTSGLIRGNRAIARKHGIEWVRPRPPEPTRMVPTSIRLPASTYLSGELKEHVERSNPVRSIFQMMSDPYRPVASKRRLEKLFKADEPYIHGGIPVNVYAKEMVGNPNVLKAIMNSEERKRALQAVFMRHELNEARIAQQRFREFKKKYPGTSPLGSKYFIEMDRIGTHVSPKVLSRESASLVGLDPYVQRMMRDLRASEPAFPFFGSQLGAVRELYGKRLTGPYR